MKRYMCRRWVLAAAALVPLLASPAGAQTNGFLLQCGSARSAGKACLNRGQEGVPSSLFRDPANIVQFERPALEVDVAVIVPSLSFTNDVNADARGSTHAYPVPTVAYVGPRIGGRLAWGVGMEGIGGMGADFRLDHMLLGTGLEYRSMFGAVKAGPVLAYELTDRLSVGASASYAYGMITDFRMPFALPSAAAAGMAGLAQLDPAHYPALFGGLTEMYVYGDSEGFAGSGIGADFGVTYRGDAFTVSASFSPEMTLEMDGATVTMDMTEQFGALFGALVQERMMNHGEDAATAQASVAGLLTAAGLDLMLQPVAEYEGSTEMTTPLTAGVGVGFTPVAGWTVGLEAEFRQWSGAMRTMPFAMEAGDNPNINLLVNGDPGNGDFMYPFPLEWEDAWTFKVGVERWLGGNAMRLGYIYGENPVPSNTVFAAFPAISTQAVSAGMTLRVGRVPVDVSGTYWFENALTGASPHMISSEYAASDVSLGGFGVNVSFIHTF
jgi:long-subunit fatty acid transport protein